MANAFSRSWQITKISFSILRADKELLFFPLLAGIFSVLFILAALVPTIGIYAYGWELSSIGKWMLYSGYFLVYFLIAFIAIFFNVCIVYTTKKRLEGRNAAFSESIHFAYSRIGLIAKWSIVSASVGMAIRLIDSILERLGFLGEFGRSALMGFLSFAWSIATIFVIPLMVYKGLKPIDAVKRSSQIIRKTWGELLVREVGFTAVQFLFFALGFGLLIGLIFSLLYLPIFENGSHFSFFFAFGVVFLAIYFILFVVFFSAMHTIFNTILYVYAEFGKTQKGVDKELLKHIFRPKSRPSAFV